MLRYEEFEQVLLRISSPWLKKVESQVVPDQKIITGITVNTRIYDHFLNCCEVIGRNTVLLKNTVKILSNLFFALRYLSPQKS